MFTYLIKRKLRMSIRSAIRFVPATSPVSDHVTKFGGQPAWLEAAQWPLSRETGNPMRFICQIALEESVFPGAGGAMAYVFMTDEEDNYVDGTWEPDGGENAVVIQPGAALEGIATLPIAKGPSLCDMVDSEDGKSRVAVAREYAVTLDTAPEPDYVDEAGREAWTESAYQAYAQALDGNKIGGSPIFLQGDEFPDDGKWKLLMQLDSAQVPFDVNFGDMGIAYAFIDDTNRIGKLLWQCG